jgi:AmiR/NasT family two-component response regulator
MSDELDARGSDQGVEEASEIAMERYDLSRPRALALLGRLARRHKVELPVVAAAVIAAAVARRKLERTPLRRPRQDA